MSGSRGRGMINEPIVSALRFVPTPTGEPLMNLRNRALTRTGAAAAGILAAAALFATPAYADTTADLGITVDGTTIAPGADGKFAAVSLTNAGPSAATGIVVTLDVSDLKTDKVTILESGCKPVDENGQILCYIEDDAPIASGEDIDWLFPLLKVPGATGTAGSITASIAHDGTDPNKANNSVTVNVSVGEPGADLAVWAPDVYQWSEEDDFFSTTPIAPGGTSQVYIEVANLGDAIAKGIAIVVKLPEHVTLTEPEPDCEFSADLRTATCEYDRDLVPLTYATNETDFWDAFSWAIKVSEDAPAPVTLTGGVATVAAVDEAPVEVRPTARTMTTFEVPEKFKDVDPSDNSDEFGVFVAAAGGEGGGLPLTGVRTGVIAGGGALVLALGAFLVVAARRRKVVTEA